MQEHLPHCKLFFPKSSALMVMVTPQSLQLAQPPPVPYLGVISCYRQKAIHLRVCRPASAYASTSMCTHTYTGAHTHAHTYMPLVHFTRSSVGKWLLFFSFKILKNMDLLKVFIEFVTILLLF